MTTTNLTTVGLNNQKRSSDVAVSDSVTNTQLAATLELFVLPPKSLITNVIVYVSDAGTSGDTVDITYNGDVVCNEVAVDAVGAIVGTIVAAEAYEATGGTIAVLKGAGGVDSATILRVLVEFVELDKVKEEYMIYSAT
jgi:hypothetical protein